MATLAHSYQDKPLEILRGFSALSSRLFEPLYTRACARNLWPDCGFKDDAAEVLVERLGNPYYSWYEHSSDERQAIKRCCWFDQRCLAFFERYPRGLGIEWGAGINTRFHRLCHCLSWPEFSWVDIDEPKATAIASEVLPVMDNYTLLAGDLEDVECLSKAGWSEQQPLIIVIEDVFDSMRDIEKTITPLMPLLNNGVAVHLLFNTRHYEQHNTVEHLGVDICAATYPITRSQGRWAKYASWLLGSQSIVAVEWVLNKK